jgi:hypothetical protein
MTCGCARHTTPRSCVFSAPKLMTTPRSAALKAPKPPQYPANVSMIIIARIRVVYMPTSAPPVVVPTLPKSVTPLLPPNPRLAPPLAPFLENRTCGFSGHTTLCRLKPLPPPKPLPHHYLMPSVSQVSLVWLMWRSFPARTISLSSSFMVSTWATRGLFGHDGARIWRSMTHRFSRLISQRSWYQVAFRRFLWIRSPPSCSPPLAVFQSLPSQDSLRSGELFTTSVTQGSQPLYSRSTLAYKHSHKRSRQWTTFSSGSEMWDLDVSSPNPMRVQRFASVQYALINGGCWASP